MMLSCEFEYFETAEQAIDEVLSEYFDEEEEDFSDEWEDWPEWEAPYDPSEDWEDWEDTDLELGFDPYIGCYSYDC